MRLYHLSLLVSWFGIIRCASILHPFRRNSLDQTQLAEQTRILSDHEVRLSSLEMTVSQLQVQLNNNRRPSLQRRPVIRRASRSDTSIPSIRRWPSEQSHGGGIRLPDDTDEERLAPPSC